MHFVYVISPHGFGHATRSAAVMTALQQVEPRTTFDILTAVPEQLFHQSGVQGFRYTALRSDLGLVQKSSTEEDLPATVTALGELYPLREQLITRLAQELAPREPAAVICDIAPVGIAIAQQLQIPAIVVQNFTWPWIYEGYLSREPRLEPFRAYLEELYTRATLTIVTEPSCLPLAELPSAIQRVGPIARPPRRSRSEVRTELQIPDGMPLAILTMGGIPSDLPFLDELHTDPTVHWLVGTSVREVLRNENVTFFPPQSDLYHPDLVQAADAVVSKLGYSTVAETCLYGKRLAAVERPLFREHTVLHQFVEQHLTTLPIPEREFWKGGWIPKIQDLLSQKPKRPALAPDGALRAAEAIRAVGR